MPSRFAKPPDQIEQPLDYVSEEDSVMSTMLDFLAEQRQQFVAMRGEISQAYEGFAKLVADGEVARAAALDAMKRELRGLTERVDEQEETLAETTAESSAVSTVTITPPTGVSLGTAFDVVEVEYSTSTHVLRYRTRQLTVGADGGLTFADWGEYTTIDTAVAES